MLPTEDKYTQTRAEMIDTLAYALGGRAAEELVFHEPTTGAGNDIEKASGLARAMVTQYGMSSKLGAVKYGTSGDEPFLGRNMGHERDYSDSVAAEIDAEVRALIELAHDEAWEILVEYRDVLDNMVLELMEKETISPGRHGPHLRPGREAAADGPVQRLRQAAAVRPQPPVLTPAEQDELKAQAEADGQVAVGGGAPNLASRNGTSQRAPTELATDHRRRALDYLAARLVDGKLTGAPVEEAVDLARIEKAVREILIAIGEDPDRDGLQRTPARVARAYAELFAGLRVDPAKVLTTTFEADHDELVLVRDIEVMSLCEHHLLPFKGVAHIGYIPGADGRITGLSKLARLVEVYARRPQVQERLTSQIADLLMEQLDAARRDRGAGVRAHVHGDARHPQGRRPHHHLGGTRRVPARRQVPRRGDGADQREVGTRLDDHPVGVRAVHRAARERGRLVQPGPGLLQLGDRGDHRRVHRADRGEPQQRQRLVHWSVTCWMPVTARCGRPPTPPRSP